MKNINALELLESFCEIEDVEFHNRKWMSNPFEYEYNSKKYYGATNAHKLILIPVEMIPEGIKDNPIKSFDNIFEASIIDKIIDIKSINAAINNCPKVDEYRNDEVECTECNGDGWIECCECEQERDCPRCDGTGVKGKATKTGKKINDLEAMFSILKTTFYSKMIFEIKKVVDFQKCTEIKHISGGPTSSNLFDINGIILLIMPCICESKEPYYIINYKK